MKVIIDCDPGNGIPGANVDDGLAIALSVAANQEIDLKAITIVAGNTSSCEGYAVARSMLTEFGIDIPLYLGSERALLEDPQPWRDHLDRGKHDSAVMELWEGVSPPPSFTEAPSRPAAQAIGETVLAYPGEVTIVAIGPLTNIALAMRLYPDLAKTASRIVIMGGVFNVDGYLTDTNFGFDPEAAAIVLASGANITLIPMDVTTKTLLTHEDLDVLSTIDNQMAAFLVRTLRPWISYSAATRNIDGMWIHDVVAVAILLDPYIATGRDYAVAVDLTHGPFRGRTSRWSPGTLQTRGSSVAEPPSIDVLVDIDNARLLKLLTEDIRSFA